MPTELLPNLLMLGSLVGFVVFACLHAFSVWRHRNTTTMSGRASLAAVARQWLAWGLLLAGTFVLIAAFVWQEFTVREGLLSGDGLFAVRARNGWTLDFLFSGESVEEGQLLVRLRSPAREAELQVLQWRSAALEARKQLLLKQPLELDPELVRRFQEAAADQRQLRTFGTQLASEYRLVTRELLAEQLTKQEKHQHLSTEIARLKHELAQAQAKRQLSTRKLQRLGVMVNRHVAAPAELEETQTELAVFEAQVANLHASLTSHQEEQRLLTDNMAQLQGLRTRQSQQLGDEIERTRVEMEHAIRASHAVKTQLVDDLTRAAWVQERHRLAVELELRQVEAQLQGLEVTLQVRAPFTGHIVYRDPSPNAAADATTVLVLAPPEGFTLHLRLPASEVQALVQAGPVTLELLTPAVQRRFRAALVRWHQLPVDPRFVLAELRCHPPAHAIRELASDQNVAARLVWRPPLSTTALFPFAAGAVILGGLGLILPWTRRRRPADGRREAIAHTRVHDKDASPGTREHETPTAHPMPVIVNGTASDGGRPSHAASAHTPSGVLSGILQTLAYQLRESVVHGELEPALLTALEWNLDWHHTRAVVILTTILREDSEFLGHAQHMLHRLAADASNGMTAACHHRFRRILDVVAPELVDGAAPKWEAGVHEVLR